MYLTLEVVSAQGASLGAQRRQVVGAKGLTIGRIPGNDWVIPDPYISKLHARISCVNGAFFIESLGKNPVAIGTAQNAISTNQPRPLRNGDRFFIDQYEILVSARQGDPPGTAKAPAPAASSGDPFGIQDSSVPDDDPFGAPAPARSPQRGEQLVPDVWDNPEVAGFAETTELDPLEALGGRSRPEPQLPPVNWQQSGPLGDNFQAPAMRSPAVAGGVPENWDQSALATPAPRVAAAPAPGGIPDNWERSTVMPTRPPPPAAPSRRDPAPPVPAATPAVPRPRPASASPQRSIPEPAPRPQPPTPRPLPSPAPVIPPTGPTAAPIGGAALAELLKGAGLAERELSPETAQELGQVLRIVVQGVMDVLQARSNIKSQFRLPMTRIGATENNPLKLSPNVESALHTLLVQRNPGYLPTVQAFEDAFNDIRNHQMAMLEGMRAAFKSMLESFDPERLDEQIEPGKRAGRLGFGSGKSKYQELYAAWYARLGKDADDTFRRLFGDVFAEAYEKQLERLKRISRESGKN